MKYRFLLSVAAVIIIAACGNNSGQKKSAPANEPSTSDTKSEVVEQALPELEVGKQIDLPHNSGGKVEILFQDIKKNKLSDGTYNLVIKVRFKNNTDSDFLVSNIGWKLTDEDSIEIEESGIWDPTFNSFMPGMFFFTTVDAGYGKVEEVGYHVKKGKYILNILRTKMATITIE